MQNLPVVKLVRINHRSKSCILITFGFDNKLIAHLKTGIPKVLWSKTLNSWYIENNPQNLKEIFRIFKGIAFLDASAIFEAKKNSDLKGNQFPERAKKQKIIRQLDLTKKDKKILRDYVKYLRGKMFSESTVKTYYIHILDFINYIKVTDVKEINNRDVEKFIENVCVPRHYSISTHRQIIGAIRHFKKLYPESQIEELELDLPKKSNFLPTVLSKDEIILLLQHTKNIKHRAVLALIYASGLRIGELLQLELHDIDLSRNQLFVRNSKGRKDRYVMMAKSLVPLLKNYVVTYKPQKYFVESLQPGIAYTAGSIRSFLRKSCESAGLKKRITPHTLRHSYATHLLENGVDIRYIQVLLGHSKPETTMIYTHVATKDLLEIESPLDKIVKDLRKHDEHDKGQSKLTLSGEY